MGTWGAGIFDNDAAADVVGEVSEAESWVDVSEMLDDWSEDLEEENGEEVVAIGALVCASHGKLRDIVNDDAFGEPLSAIKRFKPAPKSLIKKARKAVEKVLAPNSGMRATWAESGDPSWEAPVRRVFEQLRKLEDAKS